MDARVSIDFESGLARDPNQRGFALLEVLVAIVIAAIGLLGLIGLQAKSFQMETESYQRAQVGILLEEMVNRIHVDPVNAGCLEMLGGYVGTSGTVTPSGVCGGSQVLRAALSDWDLALKGQVTSGNTNVGAVLGARGCIELTAGTPRTYAVAIAWQGLTRQQLPTVGAGSGAGVLRAIDCGKGAYGDDESGGVSRRRVMWMSVAPARQN